MVVKEALEPVLLGLTAGVALSLILGQLLASQLFGVRGDDPLLWGAVALVVLVAGAAASCHPALRASKTEPAQALHWD